MVKNAGLGAWDGLTDLVLGILKLLKGVGEVVLWLALQNPVTSYFGLMPEFLEEDMGEMWSGVKQLLKEPGNIVEAIGQSTFDTVDEKGAAYSVSYVTTDVVAGVLLDKGLGKLRALGKADDVSKATKEAVKKAVSESGSKTINGLNIIDGKVDGKIPLAEYEKYRVDSVHNIDSDTMTLGKYEPTIRADGTKDFLIPGPGAYTVKAGDTTYFSLGTEWDKIMDTYGLDVAGQNMFDYFNKPALDDAISTGKEIRFSHNPEAYGECALKWEWDYLQEKHGYFALEKKGDFWYATK